MNVSPDFQLLVSVIVMGFIGYNLLQKENLWFKVVGGTFTVLVIFGITALFFVGIGLEILGYID